MALQPSRVAELVDEAAAISTELMKIHARARKFLAFNTALAVSFTPATKTFTATAATDVCAATAHGLLIGQKGRVTTTGTLPGGLASNTDYFMTVVNANDFKLAATLANALAGTPVIDITSTGSGTHTFNPVPDYIAEETNGTSNISGRVFDRTQASNAIGSITQFDNYMRNQIVTQGDHLGTLSQLAKANGS